MTSARLPVPGQDDGTWGDLLNDYLLVEHNPDGTLKRGADIDQAQADAAQALVTAQQAASATIADGSVTKVKLATAVQTSLDKADTALQVAPVTSVNSQTGVVTLTKSSVNLGNVDNTSDANKPISLATQTALNLKANSSSLAAVATTGAYADLTGKPTIPTVVSADATTLGIVQLAGDLAGTAANPTVPGLAAKAPTASPVFTGKVTTPALQVTAGAGTPNQVLTSDANGNATWANQLVQGVQVNGGATQTGIVSVSAAQVLTPTPVKSTAYTAAAGDFVPVDASSANVTITLPTAPADKSRIGVKLVSVNGSFTASVITGGSDVFNKTGGATTATLSLLDQTIILQYSTTGAIWYAQSADVPLSQTDVRYAQLATANTFSGNVAAPAVSASGLTGAVAASRYAGATTSGAPNTGTFAVGDFVVDQTAKIWVCTIAGSPGTWTGLISSPTAHAKTHGKGGSDELYFAGGHGRDSAVEVGPRWSFASSTNSVTGNRQYFMYFTPSADITISKIEMFNGTAQTGATLIRMGLYTIDGSNNLTLVARTTSDTTIFASANSANQRALDTTGGYPASYALSAGIRYAFSFLVYGASVQPTVFGSSSFGPNVAAVTGITPYIARYNSGAPTDLAASLTFASTTGMNTTFYAAGLI